MPLPQLLHPFVHLPRHSARQDNGRRRRLIRLCLMMLPHWRASAANPICGALACCIRCGCRLRRGRAAWVCVRLLLRVIRQIWHRPSITLLSKPGRTLHAQQGTALRHCLQSSEASGRRTRCQPWRARTCASPASALKASRASMTSASSCGCAAAAGAGEAGS